MKGKLKIISMIMGMMLMFSFHANAQLPNDLSKLKSSQITDAQLMQYVQQAQASGMGEADFINELQKRGLPDSEIQLLSTRLKGMMGGGATETAVQSESGAKTTSNKRVFKGELNPIKPIQQPSRVFGAELFSSADPLFVPNLKLATPKGYVIGAEDELQLDIYGNNISSQKLMVNPDGFITVKYAGPINVNGMTIEQAAGVIKARLTKYYPALVSGETKVQLSLGSVRSILVTVIGAVRKPGTVTLPSIATLFNALYASGGPAENGSFRNIELVRNSKVIAVADLYDFIMKGDQSGNLALRDNDVIRVPFVKNQVVLDGELNRKGIFEAKQGETIDQMLVYAGGFKSNAFKGRIAGTRFTDIERKIIDVPREKYSSFQVENGDSLYVDSVVNRFENRVYISGAVFKPGAYALERDMDLLALISKAQGLKEDAFVSRANMVRKRQDMTKEYKTVNLEAVLGKNELILLKKEDSLHVMSILELRDSAVVSIQGPVKKPGDYRYEDSLSLQGLLLQAGGLLENATPLKIEIGRRKQDVSIGEKGAFTSEIISVDLDKNLKLSGMDVVLKPFDVVSVKIDPTKVRQVTVLVTGEVVYAGNYTLSNPEERLSSVVNRAGGLLPYADINGAKLIRRRGQVDTAQIKRVSLSNLKLSAMNGKDQDTSRFASNKEFESQTTEVALDLAKILQKPGSEDDVTLQDGDQLIVPKFVNTVSVNGEVLKPVTVQFETRKGLEGYISAAGGFNRSAYKQRIFVVYPNGGSAKTTSFLGIRSYPKVTPGSTIFVPLKPNTTKSFDTAKAGVLVSAFSAVMTTLVLLFR